MNYDEMLNNAYKKMPEKTESTDRFEAPKFQALIQGKQTLIKNLAEVADKLRRDPEHIVKFLSKELAVPIAHDGKRATMQGVFREDLLNSRLVKYINEFVLCKECKKPDTSIISFEGVKYKRCEVCGARAPVRGV